MRLCLLLLVVGCGRVGFDELDALVVSTAEDRLAGPTTMTSQDEVLADDLSLREALTIAANRTGDDDIVFLSRVFPLDAPTVIVLGTPLEIGGNGTNVDATGRGVVIETPASFAGSPLRITGSSNSVRGLTMRGPSPRIHVDQAQGAQVEAVDFPATGGTAVSVSNSMQIVLVGLTIEQAQGNAIEIASSTDVKVSGITIEQPTGVAINAVSSTEVEITGSKIVLDKTASNPGVLFVDVDRSKIHDNVIDPGPVRLISLESSTGNEITGNIVDGGNVGIGLFGDSVANLVFRNVIMFADNEAMFIDVTALGNRVIHNTLFMNSSGISDTAPDTEIVNSLESSSAADFVDPGQYDFRLVQTSAAIDAATDTGLDLLPDSPERFLGAAPDLGAVETR